MLYGGNANFIQAHAKIPAELAAAADQLAAQGKTPLFFAEDQRLLGVIAVADAIKPDSAEAIRQLRDLGLEVMMVTGDNERTANAVGAQAGVDRVFAGILPAGKEEIVRSLQAQGKVAMVGDGINDAPALARADVGIAIGAGTDVAMDSAGIVLMNSTLRDAVAAIRLSRMTLRNIHENLFWAFAYNLFCIPLAAGLFGWKMNPMIGAAAMSLSSFTVCMNALRLNLCRLHPDAKPRPQAAPQPKLVVKIEGMMCPHCEATMKAALEALPFVRTAAPSHRDGNAVLTLDGKADEALIRRTVEEKGYSFKGVETSL